MASSSAIADAAFPMPGARGEARDQMAAPEPAAYVDSGQPVADLPPLIEPTLEPFGPRPPRRSFLAPPPPPAAPTQEVTPPEAPTPVEPVVARAEPAPAAAPSSPPPRWLAAARATLPHGSRLWLVGVAGIAVALALVVGAEVLRIGPFSPVRQYTASAAPSDPALRVAYYQEGARAGDANAEHQLAILYAKGEGVAQDYATAATWFQAAANQGASRAQYDLGVLYERGRGVQVDLTQAASLYLKAAQAGHPLAEYNVAVCYTKGQGIRKDLPEAALWYRRAAVQGVVQAMINLGMVYEKGEGVAASPVDAYAWYLAAGRRNNEAASRRAADVYAALPQLDQIRAEALASDVAASIHDPEHGESAAANPESSGTAGH